jgi:F-type H+-transporting ATPase subunit a
MTRQELRRLARHPVVAGLGLVFGLALLFGTPILAQHGNEAAPSSAETHAAEAAPHHEEGTVHPPTLVSIAAGLIEGRAVHESKDAVHPAARFILRYQAPIFSLLIIIILSTLCIAGARAMTMVPGRFQNVVEWAIEGLDNFIGGVLGSEGRRFVPFLGTLFLYIYFQNVFGLIPLMFTPTSMIESTASLAICVFLYVQWTAVRMNGVVGYLRHLAGDPQDLTGYLMSPLLFPLHVIGELARPLSLSLRLFGNMMGEETLIAVFIGLGISVLSFTHLPVGVPLQVPFMFLALLTTLIQALVFTLLSTIYFALVLPHPHEEGAH